VKQRHLFPVAAGFVIGLTCGVGFMLLLVRSLGAAIASGVQSKVGTAVYAAIDTALDNDSYHIPRAIQRRTTEDTSKFVEEHLKTVDHLSGREEHLAFATSKVDPKLAVDGLFCEFGVAGGYTINIIADHVKAKVHGFDSFEGLPETWDTFGKGSFRQDGLPVVRPNVILHKGWFDKTLPQFRQEYTQPLAFLHLDADLYSSTKTVFDLLGDRIVPGTVIAFDEFFNYPNWENGGEYKAFREFMLANKKAFAYLGYANTQLSVKILPTASASAALPNFARR
jgi:hypothetical protein